MNKSNQLHFLQDAPSYPKVNNPSFDLLPYKELVGDWQTFSRFVSSKPMCQIHGYKPCIEHSGRDHQELESSTLWASLKGTCPSQAVSGWSWIWIPGDGPSSATFNFYKVRGTNRVLNEQQVNSVPILTGSLHSGRF